MIMKKTSLSLFSNCDDLNDVRNSVEAFVENTYGHVVKDITEASKWLSDGTDEVRWGDTQSDEFELDNETARVHVKIEECYNEAGYCYIVTVEEA